MLWPEAGVCYLTVCINKHAHDWCTCGTADNSTEPLSCPKFVQGTAHISL